MKAMTSWGGSRGGGGGGSSFSVEGVKMHMCLYRSVLICSVVVKMLMFLGSLIACFLIPIRRSSHG